MNISRREKILLLVTLYLALIFAFYKLWYSPLNQQLAILKQENIRLSSEKADLQRMSQEKKRRQAEIQKLLAENKRMEQIIPKDKEIVALLEELQIAADKSGVKLLSVEYQKGAASPEETVASNKPDRQQAVNHAPAQLPASSPARKPFVQVSGPYKTGVQILGLNISAAGRYYQLRNFLLQVEKARRIISVQSCSLLAEPKQTVADSDPASGTAAASVNSKDPPPPPPAAKGERNAAKDKENTATNVSQSSAPVGKAMDRYDMSNMQMKLQINTFYSP